MGAGAGGAVGVERRMWRGRRTVLALCARRVCVARAVRRRAGAGAREKRRVNERAWRGERRCVRAVCGKGDVCGVGDVCAAWAMRGVRAVSSGHGMKVCKSGR